MFCQAALLCIPASCVCICPISPGSLRQWVLLVLMFADIGSERCYYIALICVSLVTGVIVVLFT